MSSFSIIFRYSKMFSARKLQEHDIGSSEQLVLMYLAKYGKTNQNEIAKHFALDKGSIAKTISKLEDKGLIDRYENYDNKREKLTSLSHKGEDIIKYMSQVLDEWYEHIFDGLSKDDIAYIEKIASIMAANATKAIDKDWSDIDDQGK